MNREGGASWGSDLGVSMFLPSSLLLSHYYLAIPFLSPGFSEGAAKPKHRIKSLHSALPSPWEASEKTCAGGQGGERLLHPPAVSSGSRGHRAAGTGAV